MKARDKDLTLVRSGIDPIEERERQKAAAKIVAPSFDDCAKLYIAAHEPSWRNARHRQQWTNTLRDYASPVFGSMPVEAITLGAHSRSLDAFVAQDARDGFPRERDGGIAARALAFVSARPS